MVKRRSYGPIYHSALFPSVRLSYNRNFKPLQKNKKMYTFFKTVLWSFFIHVFSLIMALQHVQMTKRFPRMHLLKRHFSWIAYTKE